MGNSTWRELRCSSYNPKKFNGNLMKLKVVIHPAEEDGFWAEVQAIAGCAPLKAKPLKSF
jgi:hypothetical protein